MLAGSLTRLMPGDEVTVNVLVRPESDLATFDGTTVVFSAQETWRVPVVVGGARLVHDWLKWTEAAEDIEQHSAPDWWSGAKFGVSLPSDVERWGYKLKRDQIFIHWGPYSVPAWTDQGKYAEWYDWWLHEEAPEGTSEWYLPH
jgi:alpha-L-fucosidase